MGITRRTLIALPAGAALAAGAGTPAYATARAGTPAPAAAGTGTPAHAAAGAGAPAHPAAPRPVVFIHGSAGSAMQFRVQAKRLAGNGYPAGIIEAHEYDSPNIVAILADVWAGLDARIDRLLAASGADRVDLLAHSLGTYVTQGYLNSSPERAARVAHYVNLDGRPAAALPGGVPTLAIWGEGDPARTVAGATNVSFPEQSHTQTVSSAESFTAIHRFLRGCDPRITEVRSTRTAYVSGRAVLFPSNAGVADAELEIYPVHHATGRRLRGRPVARIAVGAGGAFGPVPLDPHARYEFALLRAGQSVHHFYFEPFRRTDTFVRLLTSRPGEGLGALVDTSDRHTALTFQRQKEWWGGEGDHLWINGQDILNPATAPHNRRVIGVFAFDDDSDGVTDLTAPLPEFIAQPFISGVDLFIPAYTGRAGTEAGRAGRAHAGRTVEVVTQERGAGRTRLSVPAWPSSGHRVSLEFG
ncbi:pimeloyl-ACP methyl ester carboxylesterase [Actinoplanes campanulatus]|uniref:Pimeloyl-ACP methyl ester carboxylesterase n=1 Tax=Actinoplanes campanulatus TaxID=113559 RepID=A0A7W5FK34_9ACTN|nr:alpha/beta hydrolase [Actinoplanes campanulatus]MBB3101155.1 pimeloyl-ACP methyl ester carboxylesterase [Actinoplanes campanulatus]GGN49982.1 lipase [Actinoplanes campanulatus]GID41902.1 lipase [Actinoplanes campanulatus]